MIWLDGCKKLFLFFFNTNTSRHRIKLEPRYIEAQGPILSFKVPFVRFGQVTPWERTQKWHLQKSASDDGVKIELRPVLAQFKANNLSFPSPGMLLSGL